MCLCVCFANLRQEQFLCVSNMVVFIKKVIFMGLKSNYSMLSSLISMLHIEHTNELQRQRRTIRSLLCSTV